ncbi:GGDEF domain-containing protein, partial [Aduncisulcus paluster]
MKQLVSIAFSALREDDSIGRYGGDEFFIILPDQTASQAIKIADRFRQNVMEQTEPPYTISIGISTYPWDGESHKELIKIADDGLYKSKELGRNRASYTGYL